MKKYMKILSLVMAVLLVTGCYAEISPDDSQGTSSSLPPAASSQETEPSPYADTETFPIPTPPENVTSISENSFFGLTVPGDHYCSISGSRIRYGDLTTGKASFWCYQAGCTHTDETCPAYVKGLESFLIYDGMWYCLCVTDDNSGYRLLRIDPQTNERSTMAEWIPERDSDHYYMSTLWAAYGKLYLGMDFYSVDEDFENSGWMFNGTPTDGVTILETRIDCFDLNSMEHSHYPVNPDYDIKAYTPNGTALVQKSVSEYENDIDQLDKDCKAYNEEHGLDLTNPRFELLHTYSELGLLDLASGTYTLLVDSVHDGFIPTADRSYIYGDQFIYLCSDSLYIYDLKTGTSRKIVEMENIINYWVLDNKAFFITCLPESRNTVSIWFAPLEGGEPVQMRNKGNRTYMECSIVGESDNYFVEGRTWLTKRDFYTEF